METFIAVVAVLGMMVLVVVVCLHDTHSQPKN
jgi:hypothetical protein